jgi:hypothetical protein
MCSLVVKLQNISFFKNKIEVSTKERLEKIDFKMLNKVFLLVVMGSELRLCVFESVILLELHL